jgi:hypothetical protein
VYIVGRISTHVVMQCSLRMWRIGLRRSVRGNRYLSDDVHAKSQNLSADKTSAVTSYYFEPAIDRASAKVHKVFSFS